jgi:hypothetical protein
VLCASFVEKNYFIYNHIFPSIDRFFVPGCKASEPYTGRSQEAKYVESWPNTTSAWLGWLE